MRLLERLPRETSRDHALRTIKENIVDLTLPPGSQISENELAVELGLSRTPVREALIELSKVYVIEIYPQRKSRVPLIDCEMVEESRFMRCLLECAVVELDCEMATASDLERLEDNVRLQSICLDGCCTGRLRALDRQFHEMLFAIAKKSRIYQHIQNISIHFDRVRGMALSSVKDRELVQDHRELVQAIGRRDARAARERMEIHMDRCQIESAALREVYPHYFK